MSKPKRVWTNHDYDEDYFTTDSAIAEEFNYPEFIRRDVALKAMRKANNFGSGASEYALNKFLDRELEIPDAG